MDNLKNLLDKFKNLINHSGDEKKTVAVAIKKHTNISIDEKDIVVGDGFVRINAHPAIQSEIYIKKPKILADLNEALKPKTFKDIR